MRFSAPHPATRTAIGDAYSHDHDWVDPVAGAVKAAQVLRSEGVLAVFGHAFELPPELRRVLATVLSQLTPDSSVPFGADPPKSVVQAYESRYAKAADAMRQVDQFSDAEQWRIDWERSYLEMSGQTRFRPWAS